MLSGALWRRLSVRRSIYLCKGGYLADVLGSEMALGPSQNAVVVGGLIEAAIGQEYWETLAMRRGGEQ